MAKIVIIAVEHGQRCVHRHYQLNEYETLIVVDGELWFQVVSTGLQTLLTLKTKATSSRVLGICQPGDAKSAVCNFCLQVSPTLPRKKDGRRQGGAWEKHIRNIDIPDFVSENLDLSVDPSGESVKINGFSNAAKQLPLVTRGSSILSNFTMLPLGSPLPSLVSLRMGIVVS